MQFEMNRDFEALKEQLLARLTSAEAERVIVNLELIFRNRAIRNRFIELKPKYGSRTVIQLLADKFCLGVKSIEAVVYSNKKESTETLEFNK